MTKTAKSTTFPDDEVSEETYKKIITSDGEHAFLCMVSPETISFSSTNDMFRDESELSEQALKDLADSIREKGLIQPVLLRPKGNGNYILVAGERRVRACKYVGLRQIPAYVRDMTEQEALDLQITENLQRKDVHPMKEAKAYKIMMEKWTPAEIGARLGKSESYVLQRLRLNSLIPEVAKDFAADSLTLGQALLISKLEKADQVELANECSSRAGWDGKSKYYDSIEQLEEYIDNNITMELKNASWDLNDAALVAKAGSCSACSKRSGAQGGLFADIKQKDRCFDRGCFRDKRNAIVAKKLVELIEKKPDTLFLEEHVHMAEDKVSNDIAQILKDYAIVPLKENTGWTTNSWYSELKKKATGFVLNGERAGKTISVYVRGPKNADVKKAAETGEATAEDIKASIDRIKQRTERAAELDEEKIYGKVIGLVEEAFLKDKDPKPTDGDWALMAGLVFELLGYRQDDFKGFRIPEIEDYTIEEYSKQAEALKKLSSNPSNMAKLARFAALNSREAFHLPQKVRTTVGQLILKAAPGWGVDVDSIVKAQAEERRIREERAAKRIKDLQGQLPKKKASK